MAIKCSKVRRGGDATTDFTRALVENPNLWHLLSRVLDFLDARSIENCQLLSRSWAAAISSTFIQNRLNARLKQQQESDEVVAWQENYAFLWI